MAKEEIKLVGSFKDEITPQLKKLSKQIDSIGRSFQKFNKNLRPLTREFGKLAVSSKAFNDTLAAQGRLITNNARAMRDYRTQSGKMVGAMRSVERQREKAMRQRGVSRHQSRRAAKGAGGMPYAPVPVPSTRAPKAPKAPKTPKGRAAAPAAIPNAAKVGAQAGQGFASAVGSTAIGTTIGMMASQALMGAANRIGNMIAMPFKKFGDMFAERSRDEMDDIKSAGGLYALDQDLTAQSGNERFFKNYNEALRYQEKLNIDMAQSAASLPGVTSQYVATSRQLTDTIQMVMEKDRDKFNVMAQKFGANVSGGGVDASKEALRTVLQKQTEQVMLQSQGQQGGLPMHIMIQQLLGKEAKGGKLGIQAFTNRFRAAFQKNPLLKNFLLRAEKDLAGTEAGSVERLQLLLETFDRAMPKEVINKMRGSISGMMEALRSGLLDPQAGMFGMSRANIDPKTGQEIMKRNVDDLGNILFSITDQTLKVGNEAQVKMLKELNIDKKVGESLKGAELTAEQLKALGLGLSVVGDTVKMGNKEVGGVSKSTTYIFEQIREILAGYGPVLLEFVGFLPSLFDPFGEMTKNLMDFRDNAQKFINKFNNNLQKFEDVADSYARMTDPEKQGLGSLLKKQSRSRAAFGTMAKFLEGIGGIDANLSKRIQDVAGATSEAGIRAVEAGEMSKLFVPLFQSLVNSDLMAEFGKIGGIIIGGITKAVVMMIKGVTSFAKGKGTNKLMDGFIDGIATAFGDMSFNDAKFIITDAVVSVLSKAIDLLFTQVIPNLVQMYIGSLFQGLFSGSIITTLFSALGLMKIGGMIATLFGGLSTLFTGLASAITFVTANFTLLSGIVGTVLVAVVAPVLAVAGAIMILIAVFRNFGNIVKMIGGGLKMMFADLINAASAYIGAIGNIVSWIPGLQNVGEGLKGVGQGMKDMGKKMKEEGLKDVTDAAAGMKKQFDEDTAAIKNKFGQFTNTLLPATTAAGQFATATNEATEAQKKAAEAALTSSERKAILGTQGLEMPTYVKNKAEIDSQIAELRKGRIQPGSSADPAPAMKTVEDGMTKVGDSAQPASAALDKVGTSADATSSSLKKATSLIEAIPPKVEEALVGSATSAGDAITQAAQGLAKALNAAAQSIQQAAQAKPSTSDTAGGAYGGYFGGALKSMPLGQAIATEKKNMPAGAELIIANSSETIIPAYSGNIGQGFKGFSFEELESAAGFNRMATYTEQIADIADKTANSFAMGGALGGGSATLQAMEALGHANGLMTTSGFRPGDPGFHGVNRARDLSNGSGETPEMNKVANMMASNFGSSLTELIYTPLGYSIKNGQKTGLISPDNHYHHIHVAVAEGLAKAAVFNSQMAAEQYERRMMPAGAEPMKVNLASMTANSSELGGGGVTMGDINVSVSGVDDPKAIANQVAEEILYAIEKTTYSEVFTS